MALDDLMAQRRIGRPPKCGGCGECEKCARAAYMRAWYASKTPDHRRSIRSKNHTDKRTWSDRKGVEGGKGGRNAARIKARRAVDAGLITKQPCERCGAGYVHAHHEDYGKPLEVMWLCPFHHSARHRERAVEQAVQPLV